MSIYNWDVKQVYRAKKDYDCYGSVISKETLVQIWQYEGSSIGLKDEHNKIYWIQAKDLLNVENFKKVF